MRRRHDVRVTAIFPLNTVRGEVPVYRLSSMVPALAPKIVPTLDVPVIYPTAGEYYAAQLITITVPGASSVFYTVDGSDPTQDSNLYEGPFSIATPGITEIRARAFQLDYNPSVIISSIYSIALTVAAPTISLSTDVPITSASLYAITCDDAAAAIHYTVDGSDPTQDSPLYTAPFTLSAGTYTIKARAYLDGYQPSGLCVIRIAA